MPYLYISLNKSASQYAISLDDVFMTLYGCGRKKTWIGNSDNLKKGSYVGAGNLIRKEIPGIVYRIKVTQFQHDKVRDILCDFLIYSHKYRYRFKRGEYNFTSAEFIAYILIESGIVNLNSTEDITGDNLTALSDVSYADVVYEGDLRNYEIKRGSNGNSRLLDRVKENKKVMEHGTAQYEYVPHEV